MHPNYPSSPATAAVAGPLVAAAAALTAAAAEGSCCCCCCCQLAAGLRAAVCCLGVAQGVCWPLLLLERGRLPIANTCNTNRQKLTSIMETELTGAYEVPGPSEVSALHLVKQQSHQQLHIHGTCCGQAPSINLSPQVQHVQA
jgi:hypothetical protein